MLELIVWACAFSFLMGAVLVLHYWYNLFQSRDQYSREEILDILTILKEQIQRLTGSQEISLVGTAIFAGVITAWILALFGGLVSPDSSTAPDHAEAEMPNYFFQSALFILILHLVWPSMKEFVSDRMGSDSPISQLLEAEVPYFFGLATALGAINIAVWGIYHEMLFLFCFLNMVIMLAYVGYRLQGLESPGGGGPPQKMGR